MKNKTVLGWIILIIFIFGLIIGSLNPKSQSIYFQENIDNFEDQITTPNNQYQPKSNGPSPSLPSKIALSIDQKINQVCSGLIKKVASLFTD